MLSIGKLRPGRAEYYLTTVATGAEEYYLGSGEAPGRWLGTGAGHLGLAGEVGGPELRNILAGRHPSGGALLAAQGPKRVPGFDCTFNAPKSVSLLFALGAADVRRAVSAAHDAAVDAAMAAFEDEAARVRRGRGGARIVEADGFVAAGFRHRTSRSGDPHLHTHVVVANLAHAPVDDRWTALDGRQLYAWCRTVGFLYEAHLRAELTARLGVTWERPRNGIADVAGIPRRVIEHFSQRRRQIVDHMAEAGTLGPHAAQVAAYATRQAKDTSVPYATLKAWWATRAATAGLTDRALGDVCDSTARQRPTAGDLEVLYNRLDAPDGLTEHRPTFDRRDVLRQICAESTAGAAATDVVAWAEDYLCSRHVVPLAEPGVGRIRRADGRTAPIPTDTLRWTTPDMLRVERHLIQMATHRRHAGAGLAQADHVEQAIAERATLSAEQQVMVRRICGSGDGVDVVPGVAGSGKTHALAAANQAWQASGRAVIGVALSAQAARQLETGSGITSSTIKRLQDDLTRPGSPGLGPGHVLVVDEAAMVGTRTLVDLVAHAHRGGAKVVLIGDACQLPEIDAGGGFAGLARRRDPVTLTTNRRQHAAWERQALSDLRLGHAAEALAAYQAHDRIHHHPDPSRVLEDMVERWWAVVADGGDALMLATTRDAVRDLNARARQRMIDGGAVSAAAVSLGEHEYAIGDQVIGLVNDHRTGMLNGTRGTVTAIDEQRAQLHVATTDSGTVHVPFAYAEAGNLAHGYAMTIHKAQGVTTGHALVLMDGTASREAIYTAMSRGRQRNDLYLSVDLERDEIAHVPEVFRDPGQVLATSILRSDAQQMAIDGR